MTVYLYGCCKRVCTPWHVAIGPAPLIFHHNYGCFLGSAATLCTVIVNALSHNINVHCAAPPAFFSFFLLFLFFFFFLFLFLYPSVSAAAASSSSIFLLFSVAFCVTVSEYITKSKVKTTFLFSAFYSFNIFDDSILTRPFRCMENKY